MERILRRAAWGLFVLLAYFIVAHAMGDWLPLSAPGDIGFVLTFTAFSMLHAGLTLGGRRLLLFFGLSVVISYFMEEVGVRTGWIFGHYHYGDMLGVKLGHVPLLIPLGWFMMIYPSWVVARALLGEVNLRRPAGSVILALLAAVTMTGWDMVMDPPMAAAGKWVWEGGGAYFGVPTHNYFGWVLTTFLIYLAFDAMSRIRATEGGQGYRFGGLFAASPVVVYVLFALEYVTPGRRPELAIIAVFFHAASRCAGTGTAGAAGGGQPRALIDQNLGRCFAIADVMRVNPQRCRNGLRLHASFCLFATRGAIFSITGCPDCVGLSCVLASAPATAGPPRRAGAAGA